MRQGNHKCVKMQITRSYVLPCDGGYLLIDTTYEKDYGKFVKALGRSGICLSDIQYILLTHHHGDHAGLVTRMEGECQAKVICHENGVELLKNGENVLAEPTVTWWAKPSMFLLESLGGLAGFRPVIIRDEDVVIHGDDDSILRSIGIEGKILFTPGHTSDSITVLLDDGNAFVGDLAFNMLNQSGIKYRHVYVDNIDDLNRSWKKIIDNGATTIHPVHGKPFPAECLKAFL